MHKAPRLLFLLFLLCNTLNTRPKIIYLISPPRALSTVFLRFMHARGDMTIFNEPSLYAFAALKDNGTLPAQFAATPPFKTFEDTKRVLMQASKAGPIFVKDISNWAYTSFYKDETFLANPDIEFCFLIRDPHASIVSFFKTRDHQKIDGYNWIVYWLLYECHYALFKKIAKLRNRTPLVISSEELAAHPEKILPRFCEHMDIEFKDSMLSWPSLENTFNPLDWNDYKSIEKCKQWHKNAIMSTHFKPCERSYAVDSFGEPTFIELEPENICTIKKIYKHYMKYYTKMHAHCIRSYE